MDTIGIFTPTPLCVCFDIEQIVTLHYFEYTKNFKFGGERHDFWEIAYVDKGEVGVLAEGDGVDLCQGEAIFHKPNEYHSIWAKGQYANIVILSFVCHSPSMAFFQNKIIRLDEGHRALLANIISAGEQCFSGPLNDVYQTKLSPDPAAPFGCAQVIKSYMELLLIALVQGNLDVSRQRRASASAKKQGHAHIAAAAKAFLEGNVYNNICFEDVLQQMCCSKSYLTRLFREQVGHSVMEYYLQLKIAEAQRLISERELSFTEIAERLHFHSIHYFSRIFKKKTGMTPSEYERSVRSLAVL